VKSFTFKLRALLRLKETKRELALSQFASSVKEVQKLVVQLAEVQERYHSVLKLLNEMQKKSFRGDQIEALSASLEIERKNVSTIELELKQAREIQESRRGIFLSKDSEYNAVIKLEEKQKKAHFFKENKKEDKELEDIIGARFLFQRINRQS
jgi:flagellar export protein FliJ